MESYEYVGTAAHQAANSETSILPTVIMLVLLVVVIPLLILYIKFIIKIWRMTNDVRHLTHEVSTIRAAIRLQNIGKPIPEMDQVTPNDLIVVSSMNDIKSGDWCINCNAPDGWLRVISVSDKGYCKVEAKTCIKGQFVFHGTLHYSELLKLRVSKNSDTKQ